MANGPTATASGLGREASAAMPARVVAQLGSGVPVGGASGGCGSTTLAAVAGEETETAVATLAGGTTLIVLSAGYPQKAYVVLHALGSNCRPDRAFGPGGIKELRFAGSDVTVNSAVALRDGGALLLGEVGPLPQTTWLVARIKADGRFDPGFGHGGWRALPWPGQAEAAAVSGSGDFVVAGGGGSGCCVRAWVTEVTSSGVVVGSFGSHGARRVPVLEDSGIAGLWVLPDGDILEQTVGGNMGCWTISVAALTSSGLPVPGFQQAYEQAPVSSVFVGGVAPRGNGFVLIGTGQDACVTARADPSASGHSYFFTASGHLDRTAGHGGQATFASAMDSLGWVLPQASGTILFVGIPNYPGSNPHGHVALRLDELLPSGRPNPRYGHDGAAEFVVPVEDSTAVMAVWTDGRRNFVLISTDGGKLLAIRQM